MSDKLTPEKLASLCTYRHSVTDETVKFAGFSIEFIREESAEMPHANDEGMPPALWAFDSQLNDKFAPDHRRVIWNMSAADVATHADTIRDILGICKKQMQADSKHMEPGTDPDEWRKEYFAESLDEIHKYDNPGSYMRALESLYNLRGIPAFLLETRGYCQGDICKVLFIYSPEWVEKVGFPGAEPGAIDLAACRADAESSLKTFGAWAWGDVWGYSIKRKGETLDSCYGFYGSNGAESGIFESICEALNPEIERRAEKRAEKQARKIAAARPDLAPQWEGAGNV